LLRSQIARKQNPEFDPMRLGTGWMKEELGVPQVLLESTFGDSHPGSTHLLRLVESAKIGVYKGGGKPSVYTATDICDGIACGHNGMRYSLVSRDIISALVEIHAMHAPHDGMVLFSSCDKAVPAHLMTMARLDLPALHFCGGSMPPGPGLINPVIGYETEDKVKRGQMSKDTEDFLLRNACPSGGSCQYMGTASTMQILSEALGLSLPGNALVPAEMNSTAALAREAGRHILFLIERNLNPKKILTRRSFLNAIMVHSAVSGSTNATLHLPAIARQAGIEITLDAFDKIHRTIPVLVSLQSSGKWPTQYLYFAGGVPGIMREIQQHLYLDEMTVTGKSLGENLDDLANRGFFEHNAMFLSNYGLKPEDIIAAIEKPRKKDGSMAVLYGNIAPAGSVVKHAAADPSTHVFTGSARVFNREEDAVEAIKRGDIKPGNIIVIRYAGPRGAGMPEMFRTTEVLYNIPELRASTAIVTDGRYSGASRGPAIGHVSPEAAAGGPIGLLEDNDIISIDIPARTLNMVGAGDKKETPEAVEKILKRRKESWVDLSEKHSGVIGLFTKNAEDTSAGATLF
jgi:dihydroxy-acid dehydratase